MGVCKSFILPMFLLPVLLITGSNSVTLSTGLGYLGKCPDGNLCLDNGCKDVQGTTPGSFHGFYPQGMAGSACITCGCNSEFKLIIGFAGGLIFTSASFLIYKRHKKLKKDEQRERDVEQLNELKEQLKELKEQLYQQQESYAEQKNKFHERYVEQQNKFEERHAEQQIKFEERCAEKQIKFEERYAEQQIKFEERHAEQQKFFEEAYAEQQNFFEVAYAEQEQQNKIEETTQRTCTEKIPSHPPWVSIGQRIFSWLASNEWLVPSIVEALQLSVPAAKPFCVLLKAVYGTVKQKRRSITLPSEAEKVEIES